MTTLLGPVPCHDCKAHVFVVRRVIAYWCTAHRRICNSESLRPTVVDDDGTLHMCQEEPCVSDR